jgi:hypothetical protein
MARTSKLTPDQWKEVERRILSGESASALGREFGISEAGIRKKLGSMFEISSRSANVKFVAEKLAEANTALAALPVAQQVVAINMAETLRDISTSLASAASLGAKTSHRLQTIAHNQVQKVDETDPAKSIEALKGVGVLTKLANESASIALNLLAANKDRLPPPDPPRPNGLAKRLSSEALREIIAAKNAAD